MLLLFHCGKYIEIYVQINVLRCRTLLFTVHLFLVQFELANRAAANEKQ